MPISVSGEYLFLSESFRPYLGFHIGMMRQGFKVGGQSGSESYFTVAPVLGAEYSINDNFGVNFNFKYGFSFYNSALTDEVENFSTISPNIGVFYKL